MAAAAPPVITDLQPRGAQRGQAFTLTVTGNSLESASVISALPAAFAPLGLREGKMAGGEANFLVELKRDAAVGLYPIRVRTVEGLSNILLFSVGPFPETTEQESQPNASEYSNDSAAYAEPLKPPVTVNGYLRGYDQDFYRVRARKGERLVFEVEARRAGSAIDPLVRVLDATGREIARNDDAPGIGVDARLEVAFPEDGDYFVAVNDSKFSAQAQNFYRLRVGAYSYADGMFPTGWRRGDQVEVEFFGGNLPVPVKIRPDLTAKSAVNGFVTVALPGDSPSLPMPFVVGDRREIIEPSSNGAVPLEAETVVNGRISQAGEVDRYKLAVTPGEYWMIELDSAALGLSRLYGLLTIYDGKGKKLASTADSAAEMEKKNFMAAAGETAADPYLAFKVPAGVNEVAVAVEDLLGRGGPGFTYRLVAEKQPPDFRLMLPTTFVNVPQDGSVSVTAIAERRGYLGAIKLSAIDPPDDLAVEGGHIPAEFGAQTLQSISRAGVLTITAKPGAKPRVVELAVFGEGTLENGGTIRRRAIGQGMATGIRGIKQKPFYAPWLNMELPVAVAPPRPAAIEVVTPRDVKLIQGQEYDIEWKFVRRSMGVATPRRVNDANIPGVGNLRVIRGMTKEGAEQGSMKLITTVGTPPMKFDMLLNATVNVDGRDEVITSPAITFDVVQGYTIEAPAQPLALTRGGNSETTAAMSWADQFNAPVTVKADNLPLGVNCSDAQVAPKAGSYTLRCDAAATAAPGEFEIEIASSSMLAGRDKENVPYTIPPVKAKLVVK